MAQAYVAPGDAGFTAKLLGESAPLLNNRERVSTLLLLLVVLGTPGIYRPKNNLASRED
jgi:hypothetical protein